MKTKSALIARLADYSAAALDYLEAGAAVGSWMYRSPYPWEFEKLNRLMRQPSTRTHRPRQTACSELHSNELTRDCAASDAATGVAPAFCTACGCAAG